MFRFLWHLGHLAMAVEQHRAIRGDTSHSPVALSKGMASVAVAMKDTGIQLRTPRKKETKRNVI